MLRKCLAAMLCATFCVSDVLAREWTDASGEFKQEGDLVDFDGKLVILKKMNGHLVALPVSQLSEADRTYVQSQSAKEIVTKSAAEDRTWTFKDGTVVAGEVVAYGKKTVVIRRQGGKVQVNQRPLDSFADKQKQLILELVEYETKTKVDTTADLDKVLVARKNEPIEITAEGVLLKLDGGEILAVPFALFSEKDLKVLQPGWQAWAAAEKNAEAQESMSAMAKAQANEYQKNKEIEQKIMMFNAAKDWYDLWEVSLTAPDGTRSSVVVPARDSRAAAQAALVQCPQCQVGPVAKIRRRY